MELNQLEALVAVADAGSFHQAAEHCGVSRSTLRARIEALEASVGRPLVVRTHRGVQPTELGARYLARARRALGEMAALASLSSEEETDLRGIIRIHAQVGTLVRPFSLFIEMARARHPELSVIVTFQEDPTRSLSQDVDVLLHFGRKVTSGPYSTVTIGEFPVQALASTAYLERCGRPATVDDLSSHRLLTWLRPGDEGTHWPLLSGGSVRVDSAFLTNSQHHLRMMAVDGVGIALVPNPELASLNRTWDGLEVVLPEVIGCTECITALIPEARRHSPRKAAWLSLLREIQQTAKSGARRR